MLEIRGFPFSAGYFGAGKGFRFPVDSEEHEKAVMGQTV